MPSEKLVKMLNKLRDEETTASLQYMNHYAVFKNRNLHGIAEYLEKVAIQEMKHAEDLTDRMLDMGLEPKSYKIGAMPLWTLNLQEAMKSNAALEVEAIKMYNDAIDLCFKEKDHITRQLLERILNEEETHRLKFEAIVESMEKIGDQKGFYGLLHIMEEKK